MIKGIQGNIVVLGFSHENLERLKDGQCVEINLEEVGIPDLKVFIFSGEDEKTMASWFTERKLH